MNILRDIVRTWMDSKSHIVYVIMIGMHWWLHKGSQHLELEMLMLG